MLQCASFYLGPLQVALGMLSIIREANSLYREGKTSEAKLLYQKCLHDAQMPRPLRDSIAICLALCELEGGERLTQDHARKTLYLVRRVGVIGPSNQTMGLYRDLETVLWALSSSRDVNASGFLINGNFSRFRFDSDEVSGHRIDLTNESDRCNAETTRCVDWMRELDVLFVFEVMNDRLLTAAKAAGISKVLYVPNLEWALVSREHEDLSSWLRLLRTEFPYVTSIARCRSIGNRLSELGISNVLVPWSIPDEVRYRRRPPERHSRQYERTILFNAGNLGYRNRRGLDIVADALSRLPPLKRRSRLVVKCNSPIDKHNLFPENENLDVDVLDHYLPDRADILRLYDEADIVLYPSRFEGFGLGLLEALHRGCFVLATDGYPMRELVTKREMLFRAEFSGYIRQAYRYDPCPDALAQKLAECVNCELDALSVDTSILRKRQERFLEAFTRLVRLN